jgi:branched-chain amino acid transport system permease protein
MDLSIFALLTQDGVTNGAIYALIALSLVLVFNVTRIILIPQGEFLAWGALTMAALESGQLPGTAWLLLGAGVIALAVEARSAERGSWWKSVLWNLAYPLTLLVLLRVLPLQALPQAVKVLITLAVIVPLGPMLYRVVFEPIADASVLVLLIAAVALHLLMEGLGLLVFGPEGSRTAPFSHAQLQFGGLQVGGHALLVIGVSLLLIAVLYLFFGHTLYGKALRATAINRDGARLLGISPALAGRLSFLLAALIGCCSGLLAAPLTTIYYDSGFLVGLKGFVAALIGGLASYPAAAAGALLVGGLESFSSFWASAYKDVMVFTLIIPVLVWRSVASHAMEDDA